jgi:hypothetical protein
MEECESMFIVLLTVQLHPFKHRGPFVKIVEEQVLYVSRAQFCQTGEQTHRIQKLEVLNQAYST